MPWPAAAAELQRRAHRLGARRQAAALPELVRLEQAIEPLDPRRWLASQAADVRLAWADRDRSIEWAGIGAAIRAAGDDLRSLRHLVRGGSAAGEPDLRYLVTARFRRGPAHPEWAPFGAVRAYLPRVEVRRWNGRTTLACHLSLPGEGLAAEVARCHAALEGLRAPRPHQPLPPLRAAGAAMPQSWAAGVAALLARIERRELHKAVLARQQPHYAATALCPVAVLDALAAHHADTFRFCVQVAPGAAFVGASPELLVRRRGRQVESEAVAGTRPRGASAAADAALAGELQASAKDRREHAFVCDYIRAELGPLCDELAASGPAVVQLANVQHLRTGFRGRLRPAVDDVDLLARLHPTPAVCGVPPAPALDCIGACEDFDRGLYGGPVGCLGPDGIDCAVAIRCGLVRGAELLLYAGAGIVEGSQPALEWQETVSKLRAFASLTEPSP